MCSMDRQDYKDSFCLKPDELKDVFRENPKLSAPDIDLKCLYQSKRLPKKVERLMDKYMLPSIHTGDLLSEVDIMMAMKQWQRVLPNLKFIGVYASDVFSKFKGMRRSFQKTISVFTKEDPRNKIGFVLNTDAINTAGSHWVAVLVCRDYIEYFDPIGKQPNENIAASLASLVPTKRLIVNESRLQPKGSIQCGIWSMMYILERVTRQSKSMNEFVNKGYTDLDMENMRSKLFAQFSQC